MFSDPRVQVARTAAAMAVLSLKGTSTPAPSASSSAACEKGVATTGTPALMASSIVPLLVCSALV